MKRERAVVYISPITRERLELLRGWAKARSWGEVIDIIVDLFVGRFEDEVLDWAASLFQEREKR